MAASGGCVSLLRLHASPHYRYNPSPIKSNPNNTRFPHSFMASLRLLSPTISPPFPTPMASPPPPLSTNNIKPRKRPSPSLIRSSSLLLSSSSSSSSSHGGDGGGGGLVRRQSEARRRVVEEDVSEEFDTWIRDSITEIVRGIEEAPFVVKVYSGGEGGGGVRFVREKVEGEEEWREVRGRWEGGRSRPPDGVMVVRLLHKGGEGVDGGNCWLQRPSTKLWGILIQGPQSVCSACCLLKTCSVGFCTHFSLKRVQSFSDDTLTQLTNFWLE